MIPVRSLAVIAALSCFAFAKDSVDDALEALAKDAAASNGTRTPRLSIVGIVPASGEDNRYGAWLSEALTSEIRRQGKFRLFERSRLEELAKEHALVLSGAMGAEEAKQVGELAPLDYLLCGTWTRLGSDVEANLRILDVVTGEVHLALRRKIPLDEGHKGLVEQQQPVARPTASDTPPGDSSGCSSWSDSVQVRLSDLTSDANVARLEDALVRLPFEDTRCAAVHYRAMDLLQKQKVPTPRYRGFLLSTLDNIALPSEDERGFYIVEHLFRTGDVGSQEWNRIQSDAMRCKQGRIGSFLAPAFLAVPGNRSVQRDRLKILMDLAAKGKIGRPLPSSYDEVFLSFLSDLQPHKDGDDDSEAWWFWQTFSPNLSMSGADKSWLPRGAREAANRLFQRAGSLDRQKALGDWMCSQWSELKDDRTLTDEVRSHLVWLDSKPDRKVELEREGKVCAEVFLRAAKANPFPSQILDLQKIALRHGWEMPGFVPSVQELSDSVRSQRFAAFLPAGELLVAYGPRAAPALPVVLKQLRRNHGQGNASTDVLCGYLAAVVGNVGTSDTAAIGLLVDVMANVGTRSSDSAETALVRLGAKAAVVLESRWDRAEDYVKLKIFKVLAASPKDARIQEWMRRRRAKTTDSSMQRAMDDILDP